MPEGISEFEGRSEFRVLDRSGDGLKLQWSANNPGEVEAARQTFSDYRGRGYTLYRLGAGDKRGEVLTEFDPAAHGILAVPWMSGG